MKCKIYKTAQKQLMEIWRYTNKNWGKEQADKYIFELHNAIEKISSSPEAWKKITYEDIRNVFYFKYKKHFVFIKILSSQSIGIISILHEKMNLPERLKDGYWPNNDI